MKIPESIHAMEPTYKIRRDAKRFSLTFEEQHEVRLAYKDASYADSFPHSYTGSAVETSRQLIWAMSAGKLTERVLEIVGHVNLLHMSGLWYRFDPAREVSRIKRST